MNFNIITLGCKVNKYESQIMSENLQQNGYVPSTDKEIADITVVNTCTVTSVSDSKNKKLVRRIRRMNPNGIIILTGCMPQAFPDDSELFENCDIVLGNSARGDLIPSIEQYLESKTQLILIKEHSKHGEAFEKMAVKNFDERTRAFIKIEDGCNRFCSYCIIPYARGRVRSKSLEDLKNEVISLTENGYKEVVLVGINLSAYGQDLGLHLLDAVKTVCSVDAVKRVRLGSIEPEMLDEKSIEQLAREEKLCPQFHLSLQSGCDETLRRMNRHYTSSEYAEIVRNLRDYFENASITTDVMVGFAGETEEEFEKSLKFVTDMSFAKVHVFPYSRRKGTAADKADNHIPQNIKEKRSKIMLNAVARSRESFLQSQIGLVEEVLFETMRSNDYCEGYTKNYTPVRVSTHDDLCGKIMNVKITEAKQDYCIGKLVD